MFYLFVCVFRFFSDCLLISLESRTDFCLKDDFLWYFKSLKISLNIQNGDFNIFKHH